jgi:hypothetical protein
LKALTLLLVQIALVGAACASSPPLLLGQPIKKEVAILVHVSKAVAHTDELGGTAAMVEALSEGLSERGVRNQVYAADDDHPGTPRIEIVVEKFDPGDAESRRVGAAFGVIGSAAAMAGDGSGYDVVVRFYRDGDAQPSCQRRFKGGIGGTDVSASSDAGDSVGSSILSQALSTACAPDPAPVVVHRSF